MYRSQPTFWYRFSCRADSPDPTTRRASRESIRAIWYYQQSPTHSIASRTRVTKIHSHCMYMYSVHSVMCTCVYRKWGPREHQQIFIKSNRRYHSHRENEHGWNIWSLFFFFFFFHVDYFKILVFTVLKAESWNKQLTVSPALRGDTRRLDKSQYPVCSTQKLEILPYILYSIRCTQCVSCVYISCIPWCAPSVSCILWDAYAYRVYMAYSVMCKFCIVCISCILCFRDQKLSAEE